MATARRLAAGVPGSGDLDEGGDCDNGRVRSDLVDELEDFVGRGDLGSGEDVGALVRRLRSEAEERGDGNASLLADALRPLLSRVQAGGVPRCTLHELEAIVYPRMWKVMEAALGGLSDGEVRTRITALGRRLEHRLADEAGR